MTHVETLILRRKALELLHGAGAAGMPRDLFGEYLAASSGAAMSDQTLDDLLRTLQGRGWIRSYTNPITEQTRWIVTAQGEGARAALQEG